MRKVDRKSVEKPKSICEPGKKGSAELQAARKHYLSSPKKSYKFVAYKGEDVLEALEGLFHGKCAYCEGNIGVVADTDVEHFRPKAKVDQCSDHLGYWWLAADWSNLLASCPLCNRSRRHRIYEPGMSRAELLASARKSAGKASSFPLSDPSKYAKKEGDVLAEEDPLLIDPTSRDPSTHLTWISGGEWSLIAPSLTAGVLDEYGLASVHTYGLNRQKLVEARTAHRRRMMLLVDQAEKELVRAAQTEDAATRAELVHSAQAIFRAIDEAYCRPENEFSMMARALFDSEWKRLIQQFEVLRSAAGAA
jgi:uncharacterized protein (TIGR02646 family)